jgi:hypothetical protein
MLLRALWVVFFVLLIMPLEATNEKEFEAILNKHQKLLPFKSKFSQVKVMKEMGLELPSKGELEVQSLGEATWTVLEPAYLKVVISPSEVKLFSDPKGSPQVHTKSLSLASQDGSWISLLAEKPTEVLQNFNISKLAANKFKVTPKSKKQGFDFLELQFSQKAALIEVFIQENSEDSLRIQFSGTKK